MSLAVDIANRGLVLLEEPPITSLADGSANAVRVAALYPGAVAHVLSKRDWGFATRRGVRLAKLAEAGPPGYPHRYALPEGVARVLDGPAPFRLEGRTLVTDQADDVFLTYVADLDEAYWPDWFKGLVSARLAMELAGAMGAEGATLARSERLYVDAEATARRADGAPAPAPGTIEATGFLAARLGGGLAR